MKRPGRVPLAAGAYLAAALGTSAAFGQNLNAVGTEIGRLETRTERLESFLTAQENPQRTIAPYTERFADAELLYRLRDYARASVLFTDIVTNYRDTPAY